MHQQMVVERAKLKRRSMDIERQLHLYELKIHSDQISISSEVHFQNVILPQLSDYSLILQCYIHLFVCVSLNVCPLSPYFLCTWKLIYTYTPLEIPTQPPVKFVALDFSYFYDT